MSGAPPAHPGVLVYCILYGTAVVGTIDVRSLLRSRRRRPEDVLCGDAVKLDSLGLGSARAPSGCLCSIWTAASGNRLCGSSSERASAAKKWEFRRRMHSEMFDKLQLYVFEKKSWLRTQCGRPRRHAPAGAPALVPAPCTALRARHVRRLVYRRPLRPGGARAQLEVRGVPHVHASGATHTANVTCAASTSDATRDAAVTVASSVHP